MSITNVNMLIGFIGIGALGGFLPFLLYLRGMKCGVEGGNASVIATIEPVITTTAGVILYNEQLELLQYIGMATVIAGVILPIVAASFGEKRQKARGENSGEDKFLAAKTDKTR